ncbi:MAG: hypothetical protein AAF203_00090, partial [Pseudomonadota bacterium]
FHLIRSGYFTGTPDDIRSSYTFSHDYPVTLKWSWLAPVSFHIKEQKGGQKVSQIFEEQFETWATKLKGPSKLCQKIVKYQEDGGLPTYYGTELSDGGRGGNSGIRPCLKVSL